MITFNWFTVNNRFYGINQCDVFRNSVRIFFIMFKLIELNFMKCCWLRVLLEQSINVSLNRFYHVFWLMGFGVLGENVSSSINQLNKNLWNSPSSIDGCRFDPILLRVLIDVFCSLMRKFLIINQLFQLKLMKKSIAIGYY